MEPWQWKGLKWDEIYCENYAQCRESETPLSQSIGKPPMQDKSGYANETVL